MIKRLIGCLLFFFVATAHGATLLPPGEVTFFDGNGQPLAGGRVYFYIPNTSSPKNTWQDSGEVNLNSNPIILNGSGRAIIYGTGTYREVVQDLNGNVIWDQLTADTSANNFSWAGTSGGNANAQTLTAPNFTQQDGQSIGFVAGLSNTSALTLSINGATPISVTKATTAGPESLTGAEVTFNNQYEVTYSATLGNFQLVSYPIPPGIGLVGTIASASTTDVGTVTSHDASVTGTTTINSLGSSASTASPFYLLQFAGSLTITESAAIGTPSGNNIVTSAGSSALAVYQGSGNWQIISYSGGMSPSGEIGYFYLASCPSGWVKADGTNSTPDMRGVYPRGLDLGRGEDPNSPTLGEFENEAVQSLGISPNGSIYVGNSTGDTGGSTTTSPTISRVLNSSDFSVTGTGNETRPKTTVLLACMKQ